MTAPETAPAEARRHARIRLGHQVRVALLTTATLIVLGHAIAALVIFRDYAGFTDHVQSVWLLLLTLWVMHLREKIHRLETEGLKFELKAELVPRLGPPLTWDKKRPPERAN